MSWLIYNSSIKSQHPKNICALHWCRLYMFLTWLSVYKEKLPVVDPNFYLPVYFNPLDHLSALSTHTIGTVLWVTHDFLTHICHLSSLPPTRRTALTFPCLLQALLPALFWFLSRIPCLLPRYCLSPLLKEVIPGAPSPSPVLHSLCLNDVVSFAYLYEAASLVLWSGNRNHASILSKEIVVFNKAL